MRWQEIVDMTPEQFNSLSLNDLKGYTQILASAGNKRIKRAQEQGFSSPSIDAVLAKGKFSTKDKSMNQMRNEFMRAKRFLESKTGTLGEFKKWRSENIAQLKKEGIEITPAQFDTFWKAYEELKKNNPEVANKGLKYNILKTIDAYQKEDPEISVDEIVSKMNEDVESIYEESQAQTAQAEEQAKELDFWNELDKISQEQEKRSNEKKGAGKATKQDRSASKAARTKARRKRK